MANTTVQPRLSDFDLDELSLRRPDASKESSAERKPVWDFLLLIRGRGHPSQCTTTFKCLVTLSAALAAFLDPISYTMLYPALPQLPNNLHTTQSVANLSTALSLIGPAIMPLYWSYMAEKIGRRIVLLSSFASFMLFVGLSAVSTSIIMLITMRFLASFSSCAGTVAGAAMVADIWPSEARGVAMSVFYLGPMAGPALGPVVGGALVEKWGWRAVQWFQTVYAGSMLLVIALFVPETLRVESHSLPCAAPGTRSKVCLRAVSECFVNPPRALNFFKYPVISISILITSVCFAAVIMAATTLQEAFHRPPYEFSYVIIGVLYLPMAVGIVLGGLLSGKCSDHVMQKQANTSLNDNEDDPGLFVPENRLGWHAYLSVALLPGSLLMYGWTIQYGIFWVVPVIAWFVIGFSTGLMFSLVTTMLTEFVPHKSASLVALNALGRNSFAAVSGSLTEPLAIAIGSGWSYTGLGVFTLFNIPAVVFFRRYGHRWRAAMDRVLGVTRPPQVAKQIYQKSHVSEGI